MTDDVEFLRCKEPGRDIIGLPDFMGLALLLEYADLEIESVVPTDVPERVESASLSDANLCDLQVASASSPRVLLSIAADTCP